MSNRNPHQGHRGRVKKEYRDNGLDHFPDHKILEMLLFYSIPRADTNEIAHDLLNRFGSFSGVFDAPQELLMGTKGIGLESATFIKFISDVIRVYMEDYSQTHSTITSSEDAKEYMQHKFLGISVEQIYMACLAANGKVIFFDKIAEGSPESVGVRPVDVIRTALRSNAVRVVLAHNHPHGLPNPSTIDVHTTSRLGAELSRIGIELFDHIIVAPSGAFSMREAGMNLGNSI